MSKIPFLNHLDLLNVSEIQNAILHKTTSGVASAAEGKIIYDTGSNTIKFYNGSQWMELSTDTSDDNTTYDLLVAQNGGSNDNPILRLDPSSGSNDDITITGGANITVTRNSATQLTIAGAAATTVGKTSGSQRSGEIELIEGSNVTITEDGTTGHFTFASTNTQRAAGTGLSLSSNTLNVNVGATGTTQTPQSITTTANRLYQVETDDQDNLVVNVPWSDSNTNTQNQYAISAADGTTTSREKIVLTGSGHNGSTTDFIEIAAGSGMSIARSGDVITLTNSRANTNTGVDMTVSTLKSKLSQDLSNATIGGSGDTITIAGNLVVSGDTITANVGTLDVEDKNITLNYHASNDTSGTANGAGLTIQDAVNASTNATMLWDATDDEFDFSHGITVPSIKINGTDSASLYQPLNSKLTELATMALATSQALADLTSGEVQKIDGTTAGTVNASKAVVVDSNKDVTGFRNITLSGELDAGSLDVSGNADIDGSLETDGLTIQGTSIATYIDNRITAREYKTSFPSSATDAGTTTTITHNLGTRDVIVQFYANVANLDGNESTGDSGAEVDQWEEIKLSNTRATTNTITVTPNIGLAANAVRVLIKEL
tara:strand:+ start:9602 stop:11413 length:1812 start_codon:yes stop_codon:yes gene_type:complete